MPDTRGSRRKGRPDAPAVLGVRHCGVTVLLDVEADAATRARSHLGSDGTIPTPGLPAHEKTSLRADAHPDHLVVDQVGRHPDQRQITTLLPDDLVPGGEWDEMGEALQRDCLTVA